MLFCRASPVDTAWTWQRVTLIVSLCGSITDSAEVFTAARVEKMVLCQVGLYERPFGLWRDLSPGNGRYNEDSWISYLCSCVWFQYWNAPFVSCWYWNSQSLVGAVRGHWAEFECLKEPFILNSHWAASVSACSLNLGINRKAALFECCSLPRHGSVFLVLFNL